MTEKTPKIYCGNGKAKFDGKMISISVCLDKIPSEHIQVGKDGRKYLALNVAENYEGKIDQYGCSHAVTVDTWKPTAKEDGPVVAAKPVAKPASSVDKLPWE